MKDRGLFWIDEGHKYMHQGDWKRPVTHPSFFLDDKIKWMDANAIDHEVIITLSQLYCNGYAKQDAIDVVTFQNDFNAKIQHEYPGRFTSGFVVQPLHLDAALAEIERCVIELGMTVLCLPTHYLSKDHNWRAIFHEENNPIFELASYHNLAVEIHPYDGPKFIKLEDENWRFHLVWMCAQTADAYHFYSLNDIAFKYPNMRTCFAHGNQFGQVNIGRRTRGYRGRPDLFEGKAEPNKVIGNINTYFDTLVHDVDSLELLKKRQGVAQIVAGLDDPYPLGEMEADDGTYPGQILDLSEQQGVITTQEKEDIWSKNVLSWLNKSSI